MVSSASHRLPSNADQCAAEALRQGVLKRRDHLKLSAALLSDTTLSASARQQINQVLDQVRAGQIHLTDT